MVKQISEYTDINALRTLMENAKRLGRDDIWGQTFRQSCVLQGKNQNDALSQGFYEMLAAYEGLLSQKNGKNTVATRTRQKLKNKGIVQCLEEWAVSTTPTQGFDFLIKHGLHELTGEYLVVQYPGRLSENAVQNAKKRLERQGIISNLTSGNLSEKNIKEAKERGGVEGQ